MECYPVHLHQIRCQGHDQAPGIKSGIQIECPVLQAACITLDAMLQKIFAWSMSLN
jgi:hypothetical protein